MRDSQKQKCCLGKMLLCICNCLIRKWFWRSYNMYMIWEAHLEVIWRCCMFLLPATDIWNSAYVGIIWKITDFTISWELMAAVNCHAYHFQTDTFWLEMDFICPTYPFFNSVSISVTYLYQPIRLIIDLDSFPEIQNRCSLKNKPLINELEEPSSSIWNNYAFLPIR